MHGSRRHLLAGAAIVPLVPAVSPPSSCQVERQDPVLPLWREWRRCHSNATTLCHRWQDLEAHLMRAIGIPQVIIRSPDNRPDIRAWSHADIDRAIECSPEREALHALLTAQQSAWNAEAKALRFDEIKQPRAEAWDQESRASDVVFNTEATSLRGR
jgi:hypothetical protein